MCCEPRWPRVLGIPGGDTLLSMAKKPEQITKAPAKQSSKPGSGSFDPSWRVVVYHGESAFLRAERTTQLREALEAHHGGLDVFSFDGQACAAADVLDECRSFGLMSAHKLVVLDNPADLVKDDNRALFERYCESPCEGTTLVLKGQTWRTGKLDAMIERHGVIVECQKPEGPKAAAWAIARADKRYNATVTPDAARRLATLLDRDLGRMDVELAKLAAAGSGPDGRGMITPELVSQFVEDERAEDFWAIQGEFLTPDPEAVLKNLRYLLDVAREPTVRVQWALNDLARKVHAAARIRAQGGNMRASARAIGIWGAGAEQIFGFAERASAEAAASLFMACARADRASKRGSDPELQLQMLAIRFARFAAGPADE